MISFDLRCESVTYVSAVVHACVHVPGMRIPVLYVCACRCMEGSRKIFLGGQPNIVGIKVVQLNVLLELQLKAFINTSLIS